MRGAEGRSQSPARCDPDSARQVLLDGALVRIEARPIPDGAPYLSMSIALVVVVMALWPLAVAALGAW